MARKPRQSDIYKLYVEPRLDDIVKWRHEGMTLDIIADRLKIPKLSLYRYSRIFKGLKEALEEGNAALVDRLEKTLYTMAIGSYVNEEKTYKNSSGEVTKKEKTKKYLQSPPLLMFALKNLAPDKWSDRSEVESTINQVIKIDIEE